MSRFFCTTNLFIATNILCKAHKQTHKLFLACGYPPHIWISTDYWCMTSRPPKFGWTRSIYVLVTFTKSDGYSIGRCGYHQHTHLIRAYGVISLGGIQYTRVKTASVKMLTEKTLYNFNVNYSDQYLEIYYLKETTKWYDSPTIVVMSPRLYIQWGTALEARLATQMDAQQTVSWHDGHMCSGKIITNIVWNLRWIYHLHRYMWHLKVYLKKSNITFINHPDSICFAGFTPITLVYQCQNSEVRRHPDFRAHGHLTR